MFYCHVCNNNIANAELLNTGEYKCSICNESFVEMIDNDSDNEMNVDNSNNNNNESSQSNNSNSQPQPQRSNNNSNYSFSFSIGNNGSTHNISYSSSFGNNSQPPDFLANLFGGNVRNNNNNNNVNNAGSANNSNVNNNNNAHDLGNLLFSQFFNRVGNNGNNNGVFVMGADGRESNIFNIGRGGNIGDILSQVMQLGANREGSRRPPAARSVIESLPEIEVTEELLKEGKECAICQNAFQVKEKGVTQLECKHHYHKSCVTPWLTNHNTCPICRHELKTDNPHYERRRRQNNNNNNNNQQSSQPTI